MDKPLVLFDLEDHVALLTLNHPEKRNALSHAMLDALHQQLARCARETEVRAVILRAAGPVFSAGHDLRELVESDEKAQRELFALCTDVMLAIRNLPKPVIAQVQGLATAAGCQLAASCDLAVASDNASFATPGVKIGLFCTTPAVALSRAVSPKKALEMLFTGAAISAQDAERYGLVNRVVPQEHLTAETLRLARQIISASAYTLGLGKRAFYEQLPLACEAAYETAQRTMVANAAAPDAQEGMRAFLEKRTPRWNA